VRIHPITYRTAINGIAVILILFVVLGLCSWAVLADTDRTVAIAMLVFIAGGFVVASLRVLALPGKNWVEVTADTITWRTPAKPKNAVSPSGSTPLATVASWAVVASEFEARKGRPLRGHSIELTKTSGERIMLPVWSPATRTGPAMEKLVSLLRNALGDRPHDTSLLG
jgi:hypothetical protein